MADRILGSMAYIEVMGPNGPVPCGEFDKFSAKQKTELKERKPLGQIKPHGQIVYGGWDLEFEGGKIDKSLAELVATMNNDLKNGEPAPKYVVTQVITHFDGTEEKYKFENTVFYGFEHNVDSNDDEIVERIKGFAPAREVL